MTCGEMCSTHGCHGGPGCAAHRTHYTPKDSDMPFRLSDLIATVAMVLLIVWLLGVYGPSLDEPPDSPVVTDAQAAAMHEYMQELSVAKACRLEHGESLVRRTADGGFVCLPRNRGRIASNH